MVTSDIRKIRVNPISIGDHAAGFKTQIRERKPKWRGKRLKAINNKMAVENCWFIKTLIMIYGLIGNP